MNSILKSSFFVKTAKVLFVNDKQNLFDDSKIIKLFSRINNQILSVVFIFLSLVCFWYEGWFLSIGLGLVSSFNLATIFLFLAVLFCDKKRLKSTKQIIYLTIFTIILFLSSLVASISGLEMGMIFTGSLLFCQFVFAFLVGSTYKNKNLVINLILSASTPLLVVGFYQIFFGGETSKLWVSASENLISTRIYGFFGSPNVFAGVLMVTAIVSLFKLFESKKWYYLTYLIASLVLLIFTFSRSAWIGGFVGIALSLILKNWRFILLIPTGLLSFLFPSIRQRVLVAFSHKYLVDSAIDGRIWATNNAFVIFKNSSVIGTGPGSYGGQTAIYYNSPVYLQGMQNGYIAIPYTDNQWIQILVQTGFVGTLSLVGFFVSHLVNNVRQYNRSKNYLSLGVIAVTISVVVFGVFANVLEFGAVSVLAGVYLGLGNYYV